MAIRVDSDMKDVADSAEKNINAQVEATRNVYEAEFVANQGVVESQMDSLLSGVRQRRDLFYIYGNDKYLSPAQCHDKFQAAGLDVPQFLLPPDHDDHIPPHIVAMTLLKMYTAKAQEEEQDDDGSERGKENGQQVSG